MNGFRRVRKAAAVLAIIILSSVSYAQESKVDIGLRANVLLGDGVPANDILGAGVIGRYRLNNGWFIGAGIDGYKYDFERPASVLGIAQDPNEDDIDAKADNTVLFGSFGRLYNETDRGFDWFWSLGLGFGSPNVEDVSGPTDTGGTFDLTFDVGNEIHLMGTLGTSYNFSENWSTSFAARVEHHFMDVTITDQVTGETAKGDCSTKRVSVLDAGGARRGDERSEESISPGGQGPNPTRFPQHSI
jgi:hypothetical protein